MRTEDRAATGRVHDRRLKGHPGPALAKYAAEGRSRPTEPFPTAHHPPLHYQQHSEDNRVLLDEAGTPQLHHDAMNLFASGRADPASPRARTWLSVSQIARLLELDPSTVRDAIKDGALPAMQPTGESGSYRIRVSHFEDYLERHGYAPDHIRDLRRTWTAWLHPPD